MRLERLNNLSLNTVTPNLLPFLCFLVQSPRSKNFFSETEVKQATILFFFGCSEVNSTWLITFMIANQHA